jgi:hypothetical protein
MRRLRIAQRTMNNKIVYVIQKRIFFIFFEIWVDLDDQLHMTKTNVRYYDDRLEAKNCIKFS